ncbi:MAG: hypothetical protein IIA50_04740 [Bacteroidetes bacterium]|nr:hypothetical protein [Bacteroidota bacterium]
MWLGVHYPSDVVSGFLLGVAAGLPTHWAGDCPLRESGT